MVILVVFSSFNVVKNLKKPDLVARQKPPLYTIDNYIVGSTTNTLLIEPTHTIRHRKVKEYHSGVEKTRL